jgi:hypothetical protein
MFYSKSTNGFYTSAINGSNIPLDAVKITDLTYQSMLAGQTAGKVISFDSIAGQPILINPPTPIPQPDAQGFLQAIKIGMGGIVAVAALPNAWALTAAINANQWPDVQSLVVDALAKTNITATQYAAIKAAATTFNIPVTL